MSKYPFSRMRVGEVVTIPAESSKGPLHTAVSKLRDAARREFGLRDDELPAFNIEEDRAAGTFIIERLPDGTVNARGPKPRQLSEEEKRKAEALEKCWQAESEHAAAAEAAALGLGEWPEMSPEMAAFNAAIEAEMRAVPYEVFIEKKRVGWE